MDCCLDDDVVVVVVVVCTKELESNSNCDLAKSMNNGDGMAGKGLCRTVVKEGEVVEDEDAVVVIVFLLSFLVM